jgi:hypothetical protein
MVYWCRGKVYFPPWQMFLIWYMTNYYSFSFHYNSAWIRLQS